MKQMCENKNYFLPVAGDDGLSYMNEYCAKCHGVNISLRWKITFNFESDCRIALNEFFDIINSDGIMQLIESKDCIIHPIPPRGASSPRLCWNIDQIHLENAQNRTLCINYQNPVSRYVPHRYIWTRNAFCWQNYQLEHSYCAEAMNTSGFGLSLHINETISFREVTEFIKAFRQMKWTYIEKDLRDSRNYTITTFDFSFPKVDFPKDEETLNYLELFKFTKVVNQQVSVFRGNLTTIPKYLEVIGGYISGENGIYGNFYNYKILNISFNISKMVNNSNEREPENLGFNWNGIQVISTYVTMGISTTSLSTTLGIHRYLGLSKSNAGKVSEHFMIVMLGLMAFRTVYLYFFLASYWPCSFSKNETVEQEASKFECEKERIMVLTKTYNQRGTIDRFLIENCVSIVKEQKTNHFRTRGLEALISTIEECWDQDAEARVSADVFMRDWFSLDRQ
ncbi:hypothetical protein KUTeg_015018 [Tegillarca granosa]|uniref:Uncharacterized protein n=1 Tax=Tegillarca granosa TaxID=220873 RepID=A0ABQ9ENW7_TEGGR|nr:hypothetical protein KUTeg_015018 [Tegillarca granosa]